MIGLLRGMAHWQSFGCIQPCSLPDPGAVTRMFIDICGAEASVTDIDWLIRGLLGEGTLATTFQNEGS
jgi:hypothetical protein